MPSSWRSVVTAAAAGVLVLSAASCGSSGSAGEDWRLPNFDAASTRSAPTSTIDRESAHTLHVVWTYRLGRPTGESGAMTATPVTADGMVFVQDMASNVVALDRSSGAVRWRHLFRARNGGPNGLAVADNTVYGATDTSAFALSAGSGKLLWRRTLVRRGEPFVDVAPLVAGSTVYLSTIGVPPNGKGAVYSLDARTGAVRWKRSTIAEPWRVPTEAGGGGAWYPPSVGGGSVYVGTANPYPYGGTRRYPNGAAYAGPALYTDSLLVLDRADGSIRWYDQVTRHDVRDYDFQLSPILGPSGATPAVFGAGKAGTVIAWNRRTRRRLWQVDVGVHAHDLGPLPTKPTAVCPGLLGGVETPMALAGGALFVPVVNLCTRGSAYGYEPLERIDPSAGTGELVALDAASGRRLWGRRLPQPDFGCATVANGVVFTSTFDGRLYGLDTRDGTTLWRHRMPAGVNACPAVSGDLLIVAAGVPGVGRNALEVAAFGSG